MLKKQGWVILAGGVLGLFGIILTHMGNPPNMGVCIACFLRDISGALGLHRALPVQYLRPEILGLVLGAFLIALFTKQVKAVGGSSTFTRFFLAVLAMIGMLVFLGCPVRLVLRLAAGDLNALLGLAGLVAGIAVGAWFLSCGFTLGPTSNQNKINGYIFPLLVLLCLFLLLFKSPYLFFSETGPGSLHAPLLISLGAGLIIGILAQRSHLCMAGGIRDFIMFRDKHLLYGFLTMLAVALIGNIIFGGFKVGFAGQPIAHSDGLWNFLGMTLCGICITLMGGCPLRQLIAASEGNTDCAVTVFGFLIGAAFAHNFGLAASAKGVPFDGQAAVVIGLLVVLGIAFLNIKFNLVQKPSVRGVSSNVN
ncbi:MAG TPA: YedE-related selenium metabolism membrane protein [Desulfotomaculum sp.]|nr:YedE-related selenium metabolism membrane protein [Desulfotomaculum sp.]HBY04504.1 YedE-related selenium metabolism membrane protein [Desulfotomaculum sp.]